MAYAWICSQNCMPAARASSYSSSGPLIRRTMSCTGTSKWWVRLLSSRIDAKGYTLAPTPDGAGQVAKLPKRFPDSAATQDLVPLVEDDALARSHRALGPSKLHPDLLAQPLDHRGNSVTLVSDPHIGLEGTGGRRVASHPGHVIGHQTSSAQQFSRPHHHTVRRPVHVHDIGPLPGGDPQAPALSDGEAERAVVVGDGAPARVDHLAGSNQVGSVPSQERAVVGAGDEAHFLGVGLAGHGEAEAHGVRPRLRFFLSTHREEAPGELVLAEHVEEIGLVLRSVNAATEMPSDRKSVV